jgi:hypothetical protein
MKKKKRKRRLHKKQRATSQGQLEEEEEYEVGEKEDTMLPLKSSKHSSTKVLTFIF